MGALAVDGSVGRSSTPSRIIRPALVTAAISPRALLRTEDTSTSCLARPPATGSGSASSVRASSPVEDSSTQQGSSVTSSGAAVVLACTPDDSSSTVRRGVPNVFATSASSLGHRLAQQAVGLEDLGERRDRRRAASPAPPPARCGRTWSAGAAASRGCSWSGSRTGRRPSSAGPARQRCRRSTGSPRSPRRCRGSRRAGRRRDGAGPRPSAGGKSCVVVRRRTGGRRRPRAAP